MTCHNTAMQAVIRWQAGDASLPPARLICMQPSQHALPPHQSNAPPAVAPFMLHLQASAASWRRITSATDKRPWKVDVLPSGIGYAAPTASDKFSAFNGTQDGGK